MHIVVHTDLICLLLKNTWQRLEPGTKIGQVKRGSDILSLWVDVDQLPQGQMYIHTVEKEVCVEQCRNRFAP